MTTQDASNNERPRVRPVPTPKVVLCPFCGGLSPNLDLCTRCKGRFDPLSRQASQNAMGPWFIRDEKNPFAPGCSFETIRMLIARGRIQPNTVLRGPTTNQFWTLAKRAPSIANLLSLCHNCQTRVDPKDFACGSCGAAFTPEPDRQHLGLAPLQHLPGQAPPAVIAALSGPPVGFDPVEVTRYGRLPMTNETRSARPPEVDEAPPSRPPADPQRRVVSTKGDDTRTWLLLGGAMVAVIVLGAVFGPDLARRLAASDPPSRIAQDNRPAPNADALVVGSGGTTHEPLEAPSMDEIPAGVATAETVVPTGESPNESAGAGPLADQIEALLREDTRESLASALEILRARAAEESAALRESIERRLARDSVRRLP